MSDIDPPDPIDPIDPVGPFDPADPIGPFERPTLIDPEVLRRRLRLNERFEPVVDLGDDHDVTLGQLVDETVVAKGWALANRLGRDPRTVLTWDPKLVRDRRIFVPVDVQAFVVTGADGEATVPVAGGPGDPAPFADPDVRAPGVHLHWALPDALLRGAIPDEADDGDDFDFPDLPDRWVVIRIQYPRGWRQARTTGWVIDSIEGSVTPLADYAGTPATTDALDTFDRLDAKVGGSLHWTATYEASINRFAFHDPLDDEMVTDGADPGRATYVVAGWATTTDRDPLGPTRSDRADLTTLLDQLRWSATDIPVGEYQHRDEDLRRADDTILTRQETIGERLEVIAQGRQERFEQVDLTASGQGIELAADRIILAADPPPYAALFHGFVAGVPTDGTLGRAADDRPSPEAIDVALGLDLNDVVAAWAADAWGAEGGSRRSLELLASAFTTDLLDRLTSSDGLNDIEEADHAGSFWSFVGPPLPNSTDDRLVNTDAAAANPLVMGRKGRAGRAGAPRQPASSRRTTATIQWSYKAGDDVIEERRRQEKERTDRILRRSGAIGQQEWRDVPKPGPRLHRPQAPILAVRGCRPALRYLGDGMFEDDGSLKVRYPSQLIDTIDGVVGGADIVPTLGSGAIPPEVLAAVREAALIDPYNGRWLAAAATAGQPPDRRSLVEQRLEAESLLLYSTDGRYHGDVSGALADIENGSPSAEPTWGRPVADLRDRRRLSVELSRWSLTGGIGPSPVGVTTWRQPWAPLWIEWQVEVAGTDSLDGWRLDDVDLVATRTPEGATITRTIAGRSPLGRGAVKAVHQAIDQWRTAQARRRTSVGYRTRRDLVDLGQFLDPLDMASGSLDGIREQLLDIDYVGGLASGPDEDDDRPPAGPEPHPLFSGRIALTRLRLVDAFGRTLEVPIDRVATTTVLEDPDRPEAITVPPRLQHGSRLLLRLIDPASRGDEAAAEAFVDQDNPERAVNPVVGFLLPDHIDEGLEFFDSAGTPLGQLGHHELTGAVRWEPAPGRPLPPSAGPLADLDDRTRIAGQLASALVQADINSRSPGAGTGTEVGEPPPDVGESPLNALLRAIDTTMWTVDTLDGTGTSGLAGLVGRPIAIVRALIRLDAPGDLDEVRMPSSAATEERQAAFDRLADQRFPVRLGDLARSDDALLGYFVDDDYGRFHLVDPRVATQARDGGRHRGQLGILGDVTTPAAAPLTHPLVAPDGVLRLQPGRTHRLTLLMLPAGKVHVTSGILPRKSIALHNDWVEAGLRRLVPSVRVGPVLVDPDQIRLPKVNLLGERQQFTRRTGPLTWRDDPIVAASQSALLPRIPHEVQEGWVRVIEDSEDESGGAADV